MTGRRAGPRQSEAAAGLGAPWNGFSPRFCRAGFEPRRGRPTSLRFEATKTRPHAGRYNVHAWLKSGAITTGVVATAIRAEIFALPHAVSENTRIGQLTPDLLTPVFRLLTDY